MTYRAEFDRKAGWRVVADYRADGGELMHVCRALDELVARETAYLLAEYRRTK